MAYGNPAPDRASIADLLALARDFDATAFTAWCTAGERVGWIANRFVRTLLDAIDVLRRRRLIRDLRFWNALAPLRET